MPDEANEGEASPARDRRIPSAQDVALFRMLASRQPVESELRGASMAPTLEGGTRIRIAPLPAGNVPRHGQLVAFLAGPQVMVHRVSYVAHGARAGGYLITQGDGNWLCDPPIRVDAIAGVVEEAFIDGAWRPVVPAARAARAFVARMSLRLLAPTLEASPAAAARLARVMSYARMSTRLLWSKLAPGNGANRGRP